MPPGTRIRAINGRPATEVLAAMRLLTSGDGTDSTSVDRAIERDFALLHRRCFGPERVFDLTVEVEEDVLQHRIFALTGDETARTYKPKAPEFLPWYYESLREGRIGWLTLNTFTAATLQAEGVDVGRFLRGIRNRWNTDVPDMLVLDLRGADGPDIRLAEDVFGLVAKMPYRALRGMSIRSGLIPEAEQFVVPVPELQVSLRGGVGTDPRGMLVLKETDQRLALRQPSEKPFTGKVYVLVDGATQQAGALLAMLAKRSGRAVLVGEAVGSNAVSFCGGRALEVTLPRSGIRVNIPLVRFVPEGLATGAQDRGEAPHYHVVQRPWYLANGKDAARRALLLTLDELR